MIPLSKADRLVLTERLVEVGLVLIKEAEMFGNTRSTSRKQRHFSRTAGRGDDMRQLS